MGSHAPSSAAQAVLVASEPVPEGVEQVKGVNFNAYNDRDITVAEMVDAMSGMGFQASAVGEAAQIINGMVRGHLCTVSSFARKRALIANLDRNYIESVPRSRNG